MTSRDLNNCVAIVTGGALGIGGATARRLSALGARTLIVDINGGAANENVRRIEEKGGVAFALERDVGEPSATREMTELAVSRWGRLDILVQNAYDGGEGRRGSAVEASEEAFDSGINLLARSLFLGAKYAVPAMEASGVFPGWTPHEESGLGTPRFARPLENVGRIVNISSVHGMLQASNSVVYETGKAAVIGMTRQMAVDFGRLGITVNAIAPGLIITERGEADIFPSVNEAGMRFLELQYAVRRTGTPYDIANAVAFLCSPSSGFVTGIVLPVDGGLTIHLQDNFAARIKDYTQSNPDMETRI